MEIDGAPLPVNPDLVYYLLYKPVGVLSTASDPGDRDIVTDLVPDEPRVFPVGRLDAGSEGLMILTNDGDLALRLTHPRYGVEKSYTVLVGTPVTDSEVRNLLAGVELDDGVARAVRATVVARHGESSLVEIVMAEGRKREVRRMMAALGHDVERLVRTRIGPIVDSDLAAGAWRRLTGDEVRWLYEAAHPAWEDAPNPRSNQ